MNTDDRIKAKKMSDTIYLMEDNEEAIIYQEAESNEANYTKWHQESFANDVASEEFLNAAAEYEKAIQQ